MQVISESNDSVIRILKKIPNGKGSRMLHYVLEEKNDEGILLYNLLTKELLLLNEEEYKKRLSNAYLRDRWFVVSEESNEKELVELVRWVLRNRQKKSKHITAYTVFTTTDCNARCFYCFELGRSRIPMTEETAHKVAAYIADHCGGKKVGIYWFGGEPLYNQSAIDIICADLRALKIDFESRAASNGYLFNAATVKKAVENWNLKRVQITMDGTEKIYNRVKAFIYKEGNPYQTVMENIGHLLDAGISVQIRLNMDLFNAEDLMTLVDELAARFKNRKGFRIYACHIFEGDTPLADSHTADEWISRDEAMRRLEDKLAYYGLVGDGGISRRFKLNACGADSGIGATILPGGEIGLCDHFSESEFIGHIDREGFDKSMVESWKERIPEIPECEECFYYPNCVRLKKCANSCVCFQQFRDGCRRKIQRQMLTTYHRWKKQECVGQIEDDNDC